MPYAPATFQDVTSMLAAVGAADIDDLYTDIPPELRADEPLQLPDGIGESELMRIASQLASRNADQSTELSFLGAGSYDHFVPAIVGSITSRSEFATAYTPYQPEISQGTLQAIFEFQTAICELAGLPVSNASLYDGATAAVEAVWMAHATTRRSRVVVLRTVDPQTRAVLATYGRAFNIEIVEVAPDPDTGTVSVESLRAELANDDIAAVIVQQPNAFGRFEAAPELVAATNDAGAVPIVSCDALSLGVLEAPGAYGAGIVVGDGQALGNQPAFGGPSFGFMAADQRFIRRMPGRIVGETVDDNGKRGWVLTLQTREQHIRREKATSNICTNQSLNALAGIIYLSWLGPVGLQDLGTLLLDRIEYTRELLTAIPGVSALHTGSNFKELVIELPIPAQQVVDRCRANGVHPGWPIGRDYPELGPNALMVAVTEQRTDSDIQRLATEIAEATR